LSNTDLRKTEPLKNIPYLSVWDRLPTGSFATACLFVLAYLILYIPIDLIFQNPANAANRIITASGEGRFVFVFGIGWFLMLVYVLLMMARGIVSDAEQLAKYTGDPDTGKRVIADVTSAKNMAYLELIIARCG